MREVFSAYWHAPYHSIFARGWRLLCTAHAQPTRAGLALTRLTGRRSATELRKRTLYSRAPHQKLTDTLGSRLRT